MALEHFFAPCPRGLEAVLAEELSALGAGQALPVGGGVGFAADWETAYRINLWSRLATRILWRVGEGAYRNEDDLYALARRVDWPAMFTARETLRVYVTAIRCPLQSLEFVTLRLKDAVCDRFRADTGDRPSIDTREPDVRVHAFLTAERATLYLDTTGDPLYQRGLRQKSVEAPLKENLAAGLLVLSGWTPQQPLLDPMCGSGTILLEAALLQANIAPGARRSFAFERLRNFRSDTWQALRQQEQAGRRPAPATPTLFGRDQDPVAYRATLANLDRAGLAGRVDLACADVLAQRAPAEAGLLLTNPPYGERLSERGELADFYPALGRTLKQGFAGWTCAFLSADTSLPKGLGLKPSRKTPLFNGNLECRLYAFRMVAGSNRARPAGA